MQTDLLNARSSEKNALVQDIYDPSPFLTWQVVYRKKDNFKWKNKALNYITNLYREFRCSFLCTGHFHTF